MTFGNHFRIVVIISSFFCFCAAGSLMADYCTASSGVSPLKISGYVTTTGGNGIPDVEVEGTNGLGMVLTDANGFYELTAPGTPWSGTITPSKTCWAFNPAFIDYVNGLK